MKTIKYAIISLAAATLTACDLDFGPTDSGSGDELLGNASTAITSLNGVYRSMFTAGWSTDGNEHQCFGLAAYNIALDAMADDFIMQAQGSGWFWQDHNYTSRDGYTTSIFRPYDVWYAHYKWIANVNYIIDRETTMQGSDADVAYVIGQAYAIRALCYLNLATWFSRPPYNPIRGTSRWDDPGVPIYTTGSGIDTKGQPRASLRKVYDRIGSDIDKAIRLLEQSVPGGEGEEGSSLAAAGDKSHIGLYTALGIKSRVCLVTGDWEGAYSSANRVITEGGYSVGTSGDIMGGMNSLTNDNVMWGASIQVAEQSGVYAGFFTHMDNTDGAYAQSAPKLVNSQLYNHIGEQDIRRGWWDPENEDSPYLGNKFRFSNAGTWLGDYIYMRVEEMYFTAAEAALRGDDETTARRLMNTVMAPRDPQYNAEYRSGTNLGATTNTWTGSLLEDILIQRRVELWGELGRLFDVRRLGQGIQRNTEDGFADDCISTMENRGIDLSSPDTWDWVMTIPLDEINANPNMDESDQNP